MNLILRRFLAAAWLGLFAAGAATACAAPRVGWRIEVKEDVHGDPHSTVDLVVNGQQVVHLVTGGAINKFAALAPGDYAAHEVPAKALCACTSWWAGSGTTYYVVSGGGGKLDLFRLDVDESDTTDEHYKKDRTIKVASP